MPAPTIERIITEIDGRNVACAHIVCHNASTLRLPALIRTGGSYCWQMVAKASEPQTVAVDVGGVSFAFPLTAMFTRFTRQYEDVPATGTGADVALRFPVGEYWLFHVKLEQGTVCTDWSPAPEDDMAAIAAVESRMTDAEAELVVQSGRIDGKVSAQTFDALAGRVSEAEAELTAQAGQIATKVAQTDFNSLGQRVSDAESDISQQANAIATKVAQADFNDLGQRVSDAESAISQQANAIATKVTQTDFNDLGQRVSTAETAISQHSDQIALKAAQTSVDSLTRRVGAAESSLSLVPGQIRAAVDDIDEFETSGSEVVMNKDEVFIRTGIFEVDVSNGSETFHLDSSGGTFDNLTVNNRFIAPNIAEKYSGPASVTIGSSGTYKSLTEFANAVSNRIIARDITVTINTSLYESVTFGGMQGVGLISINGGGYTVTGGVNFINAKVRVTISNLTVVGTVEVTNAQTLILSSCSLNANNNNYALSLRDGSAASLSACALYNAAVALIYESTACQLCGYNLRGGNSGLFITAAWSSVMMLGTRPDGSASLSACLATPADPTTLTINYGTATPTVQPATTATLSLTNSCTYYASGHWYSNGSEKRIRQGFVDMGGSGKNEVYGVMWFDRSAINGKTIKSAKITLTRISGYGRSSAVNVRLYTTPVATTSGSAETGAVDYGILGSIANGETKEFTVPTPAVQALADGAMAGLMLCVNDGALMSGRTYSVNYAHYYGYGETTPPELTVTCQ